MIEIRETKQHSFFGNYVYDQMVSKNHILRKIAKTIDFSFINEQCSDLYCLSNGRPGWSPELMFKILFLQFFYDLSDYAIEAELTDRLSFKMFVGLEVDEPPPDHSSLSRFRDRLGVERFKKFFNHIVKIAHSQGIVSGKLHIVDSTHIAAKVDLYRLKKDHKDDDTDEYIDKHSPDKDARPGKKSSKKRFFGYKAHCCMDAESEIVLTAETTPGNEKDERYLPSLIDGHDPPRVVTADKGYDCQDNHHSLSKNKIRNGIILKKNHTKHYLKEHVRRISNVAKKYRAHIEHKFAELKQYHGFAKARYWGRDKTCIQVFLTLICSNVKRMIRILYDGISPPKICLRGARA